MGAFLLAGAPISSAHACACCSEPGQRLEQTAALTSSHRDEVMALRFAPTAVLYSDAGFPDSVRGVADPQSEPYRISVGITATRIAIEATDARGRTGSVAFAMPARLTRFEIDPRTGDGTSPGNGPGLYKEWRLEGPATLAGVLAKAGTRANARLILHGSGNGCTTSADFSRWTLEVRGPGIRFTLLGDLVR